MISKKKVLVTGFSPFLDFKVNPSGEIARKLDGFKGDTYEVFGVELPVLHKEARKILEQKFSEINPDLVVGLGLAANATGIRIERVALNRYYRGEEAEERIGEVVAYETSLPYERIREALWNKGIPAYYSFNAGTYLCNEVFYTIASLCSRKGIRGGFIHIPFTHRQVIAMKKFSYPSMQEGLMIEAIKTIIEVSLV